MSLSLKNKTNIAFFAALITLAIIGWFSFQRDRSTKEYDQLVAHSRDVLEASELLRSHIYEASVARRAFTLWGDPAQIDAFDLASKSALADFATLHKLTADSTQQQLSLAQMEPLIKARLSILKASIELHQRTRDDLKQQDIFNDQSTKMSTQITDPLDKLDSAERVLLGERTATARASYSRKTRINVFLGVSVFLFLILTLGLLKRELSRREQAEHTAAEQKELLQSILDSCSDAVIVADTAGKIILRNPVGVRYNAGAPADELSEKYPELLGLYKNDGETLFKAEELPLSRALNGRSETGLEICVRPFNGAEPRWMLAAGGPLLNVKGEKRGGVVFLRDITDRKEAENRFYKVFNVSPEPTVIIAFPEGRYIGVNESFLRITGHSREESIGRTSMELKLFKRVEDRDRLIDHLKEHGSVRDIEMNFYTKAGEERVGLHSAEHIEIGGEKCIIAVLKDITERKLLEQRLRQAQKMEAIGQFSGGIAHDFNNMLGVIIGYSEILEQRLPPGDPLLKECGQIKKAGQSAASLTRQLLAFSRQQMLEPRVLSLNTVAADTEKMLRRLIGEHIELITKLAPDLGQVKADPGQIEQVILNLAVNARDAMPDGGKLIIETRNTYLDEEYTLNHPPTVPGSYVMLVMTDTGVGIDVQTQAHIFEPFFTTKEIGKGTGLGLATVYGVVKQSGGYIWVYSEPGLGSTFRIYLPRVDEPVQRNRPTLVASGTPWLEDDPGCGRRRAASRLDPHAAGGNWLHCAGGQQWQPGIRDRPAVSRTNPSVTYGHGDARNKWPRCCREVDANATRDGSHLHVWLHGLHPRGTLDSDASFLSKPITRNELLRKVYEVLSAQKEQEVTKGT